MIGFYGWLTQPREGIPVTAILRPSVIFGDGGILINNIAWALRYLPVIGVFGDGQYRLQPIFVEDLATIAIEHGRTTGNRVIDAIGPETFSYRQLICDIGNIIGKPRPIISVSPIIGLAVGKVIGGFKGDVMITKDERYPARIIFEKMIRAGYIFTYSGAQCISTEVAQQD